MPSARLLFLGACAALAGCVANEAPEACGTRTTADGRLVEICQRGGSVAVYSRDPSGADVSRDALAGAVLEEIDTAAIPRARPARPVAVGEPSLSACRTTPLSEADEAGVAPGTVALTCQIRVVLSFGAEDAPVPPR